jgi:hypothetical protein
MKSRTDVAIQNLHSAVRARAKATLVRAAVVSVATALIVACSDRVAGPGEIGDVVAKGTIVSSFWDVKDSQVNYVESMSNTVETRKNGSAFSTRSLSYQAIRLSPQEIAISKPALDAALLKVALDEVGKTDAAVKSVESQGSNSPIYRPKFDGPSFPFTTRDGKRGTIQIIESRRGRPAAAAMVYLEDRALALTEYSWKKGSKNDWKADKTRTTFFGKNGLPIAVSEDDLSRLEDVEPTRIGSSQRVNQWLASKGTRLLEMALPDAAYATTLRMEPDCLSDWLNLAASTAAYALAVSALTSATALCASSIVDPAAIAACASLWILRGMVAACGIAQTANLVALEKCRRGCNQLDESLSIPGGVGLRLSMGGGEDDDCFFSGVNGAGGTGGYECHTVQWYVSFDGGDTWYAYGDPWTECNAT